MTNEVVIKVKADNDTKGGFAAARRDAEDFGKDLVNIGKKAGDAVKDLGPKIGGGLADGLTSSFGPVGGKLVGVLGVGMAASLPMLGAAVSAAIVGGAAGAGVVGGLALAAKDPRVKASGISLGDEVMRGLEERSKVFVEPALAGIGKLRKGFREIGPDLDKIFKDSARFVEPLVDGLVSGTKKAVSGIATAISRAGPIVDAFSDSFDKIGGAVGGLFEKLSEDTESSADGFAELTDTIVTTISVTGELVSALTKTYGALGKTDDAIDSARHGVEDFITSLWSWTGSTAEFDITADGMSNVERKAKELADANEELADSARESSEANQMQTRSLKELADQLRAESEPVFALMKAHTDLGEARTKYNKAVKKYGESSAEARDELNKMAQASIELQGAIGELGDEFDGTLSPSMRANLEAAGMTKKEIDALEDEFRDAKRTGEDFAKTYRAKATVSGYDQALSNLRRLKRQADDLAGTYNVTIRQNFLMTGKPSSAIPSFQGHAHGGIKGAASGMNTDGLTWVGERGPELVSLPTGSTVHSSGDSMRMMRDGQRAAGIGDGRVQSLKLEVNPTLERTLIGVLMNALRLSIGDEGGDVQQVLGRN